MAMTTEDSRIHLFEDQDAVQAVADPTDYEQLIIDRLDAPADSTPLELFHRIIYPLAEKYLTDYELSYVVARLMPPDPDAKVPVGYKAMSEFTGKATSWNYRVYNRAITKLKRGLYAEYPGLFVYFVANEVLS